MSELRCALLLLLVWLCGCAKRDVPAVIAETRSGSVLHWSNSDIVLTRAPEVAGGQPPERLQAALGRAAQRWNRALGQCGAPRLLLNTEKLERPLVQDDVINAVILHELRWCPPGVVEPDECYPEDLTGRTHLYPRLAPGHRDDGEIAGADVELNGVRGTLDERSLEASLMHELGHVLGLDHPCGPNSQSQSSRRKVTPCQGEALERQVMHPTWAARPHGDDLNPSAAEVEAVCAVYAVRP